MSEEEQLKQLEQLINQTVEGTMAVIPAHLQEIEQNNDLLKIKDPKEFIFGLIIGSALGTAVSMLSAMKKALPTQEDQLMIRDLVYRKVPQIRERIFE